MMSLDKTLLALALGLALAACSNQASIAAKASVTSNANSAANVSTVKCWSGGYVVVDDTANGVVWFGRGGDITFTSNTTGKEIRTNAACVVTDQ